MDPYSQELRLLWFVGLNALVLAGVARCAIAFAGNRRSWVLLDVLLFNYVVEYGLVCGLGVLGLLTPANLTVGAIVIAAILFVVSQYGTKRSPTLPSEAPPGGKSLAFFILLFAAGYELAYLIYRRDLPVLETDALAYHLPVAVEWLRSGRLGIVQTWYWNPTNTYSPMGAEAFIAWLIAPMHSDLFARFVQAPALLMILLAMYRIGRTLGATPIVAACAAAATVLSRSLFLQASIVKDDLFVVAFLVTAAAALGDVAEAKRAGDRLGPIRVGCAIGLLVATKYPALIALPLVLLVIDQPLRTWNRKQHATAVIIAIVLAGPWFVRNAIEFGNPLYPIIVKLAGWHVFAGLFDTAPDPAMRTPAGVWRMITGGHFGTPWRFIFAVAILWAVGCIGVRAKNPLRHFAGFGAIAGVILFALASPYPEVRYFLPFLLPFYAGAARGLIALGRWRWLQAIVAGGFVVAATCMTFEIHLFASTVQFSVEAAVFAAAGVAMIQLWHRRRGAAIALLAIVGIAIGGIAYVQFNSFATRVADNADAIWSLPDTYGELGVAWAYVRHRLPATATIAYANTNLIEPLYGPSDARRLVYAPVRPGMHSLSDLPPLGEHVPQDQIFQVTTAAMNQNADLATWRENLRQVHANFLILVKHGSAENPPEAEFIAALKWKPIFENEAAAIYQMNEEQRLR